MMPLTFKTWIVLICLSASYAVSAQPNCFPMPDYDYATAYRDSQVSGKPLLVEFGADWCSPCRKLRKTIQTMKFNCLLEDVEYAYVDTDKEPELAAKMMIGTSIPQVVIYRGVKKNYFTRVRTEREILEFVK